MTSKERYIKFVADDMVSKTIYNGGKLIEFPFFPDDKYYSRILWNMERDEEYFPY